ncbi:hypothetical protein BHE90_017534 [Fusarium euwallaceae]|uniref:Uncharacterized protein n=1 Tax=Fusarium euwallaceae TaxID=1147111 RepID=A0A430KX68_9HYPO|nr:hypothetical protein BHE90_017534 [Fusarium euwallaceae]
MGVLSRNFRKVERIVRSLTAERLAAARVDLEGELRQDGRRRCGGAAQVPVAVRPPAERGPRLAAGIPHPRPRRGRGVSRKPWKCVQTRLANLDGIRLPKQAERFVHGQSRMDWQDKDMLVIDDVSMLGARTHRYINANIEQRISVD